MQGAEPLASFRRGPSAWRRCKEGKSGSSADSPFGESASRGSPCRPPSGGHYSSRRRRPARRTGRESANFFRAWSSGSVLICTAAWSAQGSDTWCTVSQVRQKPAPWTVWHRAIPQWAAPLLPGRSWRQERAPACGCWVWRPPLRDALPLPDLVWRVSARRHPWGWAPLLPRPRVVESGLLWGSPPGSLSKRASLLCWASVAHPMSHFQEGSGLMERTAPTALLSWLRCHGPSLSNLADPPPMSWITTGKSTNAGAGGIASCGSCRRAGFGIVVPVFQPYWRGNPVGAVFGLSAGWGLFFPTLSWPLVAAGMMVSVGLAGGVVAVSAITSSPTLVWSF